VESEWNTPAVVIIANPAPPIHDSAHTKQLPPAMTTNNNARLLARLETGFRTDVAQLTALEEQLAVTLQNAHHFGKKHGSPEDWNTRWYEQWDHVERSLARIRSRVREMDGSIESNDRERLKRALSYWEDIQSEDVQLGRLSDTVRSQAIALDGTAREEWNQLALPLESHREALAACTQALRVKLELLTNHSKEETDRLVQRVLDRLPNRAPLTGREVATHEQDYHEAALELEREQHEFRGFMDVVKALLMWDETTEERMGRNRAAGVSPRGGTETETTGGVPLKQTNEERATYAAQP
jgi:hypothetical protein